MNNISKVNNCKTIDIDVSKLTVVNVGDYTIDKIRKEIEREWKEGDRVNLDFKGLSITGAGMNRQIDYLLETLVKYNCEITDVSKEVEDEYVCYLGGNYHLIDTKYKGDEKAYFEYFKKNLELNGYDFMVRDNYYLKDIVRKTIIKPIKMDDAYFYYYELKSGYAEPKNLVGDNNVLDMFNYNKISNSDLLKRENCFRFPLKGQESEIIELISILVGNRLSLGNNK